MIGKNVARLCIGLAIVTLAACGGPTPGGGAGSAQITITTTEFAFSPVEVTLPAGGEVSVTLNNTGTLDHEWVLMDLGTSSTAPFDADDEANIFWEIEAGPGETATGTFTAPTEPGTYQVVCGTAGHLEGGMIGTAIVE